VKIEMTVAEAHDILDDLHTLDGMWEATRGLEEALQLIVMYDQAATWPRKILRPGGDENRLSDWREPDADDYTRAYLAGGTYL
jgi:hypothetical protein